MLICEIELTGVLMLVRRTYWSSYAGELLTGAAYAGEKNLLECLCW